MATTVRNRFVALELSDGWIELARGPSWTLSAIDGSASLRFTMFPVAEGVVMDLVTLRALERERHETHAKSRAGGRGRSRLLIDETSWTEGSIFCLTLTERLDLRPLGLGLGRCIQRGWTVSDGKHVVEAMLRSDTDDAFERAAPACEQMMHSVRFEGPS
jgi:hypothetical protein